jgi:chloramphenicol 3-O phosphotransferase
VTIGRIVLLNGTSSAGKTTLATAFRDARARRGEFWMLLGIDDVLAKLTAEWIDLGLPAGPGAFGHDGLFFDRTPDQMRMGVGPLVRRLLEIYHQWVASAARAGVDVIVDDVVLDRTTYESWVRTLDGLPATWVAVRCAREIAVAREAQRGDRAIGLVAAQYDVVHDGVPYSFEIDTGVLGPDGALAALQRGLSTLDR